jgi:probable O-glycosylation ligase (exosortase A-associated)
VFGPERSFIADNTALGLGLNMVIPLLFYLAVDEERIWLKWLLQVTFLLSALAVVFTYSRGALLGLLVVLALIFFHMGPIKKTVFVIIAVLALPIAVSQIPDHWFDKMETLETYEENESAMSRIAAWKAAWKLALDRPLVGGGFQITRDTQWMFETYNPDAIDDGYQTGVHSSYFEVMAENGLVTFFIWAALGISCWLSSIRIRRLARRYGFKEYQSYGYMIEGSLFAFGVSAAFLEFAMFDLLYSVVAIVIVTKTLLDEKINQFESSIETASRSDWRLRNIAASPGGAVSSRGEV